ncbi:hypothetical protein HNP86_001822 [Methanococcus maripaludis]|uniref:Uncharacterized protein n=1 Tax=Methanococcus maripaludis TaxID=39152 RepID=A0A7J9NXC1_METMI|nr:hypothetical protein [Methanococcus maripaludis]MBA2851663.1 hypothetical protein [Methanococcus maripaludis]
MIDIDETIETFRDMTGELTRAESRIFAALRKAGFKNVMVPTTGTQLLARTHSLYTIGHIKTNTIRKRGKLNEVCAILEKIPLPPVVCINLKKPVVVLDGYSVVTIYDTIIIDATLEIVSMEYRYNDLPVGVTTINENPEVYVHDRYRLTVNDFHDEIANRLTTLGVYDEFVEKLKQYNKDLQIYLDSISDVISETERYCTLCTLDKI